MSSCYPSPLGKCPLVQTVNATFTHHLWVSIQPMDRQPGPVPAPLSCLPATAAPRALAFCIRLEEHTLYLYWPLPGGPQTALVWITKSKLYVQQFPHAALAFLCHNASPTSLPPHAPHLLRYWKILNRCHLKMNGAGPWVSRLESEYCSAQLKMSRKEESAQKMPDVPVMVVFHGR